MTRVSRRQLSIFMGRLELALLDAVRVCGRLQQVVVVVVATGRPLGRHFHSSHFSSARFPRRRRPTARRPLSLELAEICELHSATRSNHGIGLIVRPCQRFVFISVLFRLQRASWLTRARLECREIRAKRPAGHRWRDEVAPIGGGTRVRLSPSWPLVISFSAGIASNNG
jgi:hypothetical protein